MRYIGKNYGIYWAKSIGYIMGYIWQTLRDIFGKNYGIFLEIMWDIFGKIMGYMRLRL